VFRPFNDPPAGSGAIQPRRPFPLFGTMTWRSQDASSQYDSLQAKFEQRLTSGSMVPGVLYMVESFRLGGEPGDRGRLCLGKGAIVFRCSPESCLELRVRLAFWKGQTLLEHCRPSD